MSTNNTNPHNLFGGTWEQLKNRFLLGAGSSYSAGTTGGESTHKLTVDEMPKHSHGLSQLGRYPTNGGANAVVGFTTQQVSTGEKGGDGSHNNMPPYLVVYMWKRTG